MLSRARPLEPMALIKPLGMLVVFDHPEQKLVIAGLTRCFDGRKQQSVPDALAPRPRVHPERGHRARPARTGLADRRHAHRLAIRFGYESCPRDDGSPPFFLRALLLALPRGPERVRRIPQRGQAHVAEDLPLLGTEVPDFSFRGRTPSAPS